MLILIVDVDGVDDKIISGHLLHTLVKLSLNLRRQHVSLVSLQEVRKAALIRLTIFLAVSQKRASRELPNIR